MRQKNGFLELKNGRADSRCVVALALLAMSLWVSAFAKSHPTTENAQARHAEANSEMAESMVVVDLVNTEKPSGRRRLQLWNPTDADAETLVQNSSALEVLEIAVFELEEPPRPSLKIFEALPRMGRLRTVAIHSNLPLKQEHFSLISRVPALEALVLSFSEEGLPDSVALDSFEPSEHLKILGVYPNNFASDFWDKFRKSHPSIQVEVYNPKVYGDVFDKNGCINGRFQSKYYRKKP